MLQTMTPLCNHAEMMLKRKNAKNIDIAEHFLKARKVLPLMTSEERLTSAKKRCATTVKASSGHS